MKKFKLSILNLLIVFLTFTIFISCSNDDKDNPKEYLYSYDIKTYVNIKSTSNKSSNGENDTDIIKTRILSTDPLDSNMREEEFAQLLIDIEPNIKIEILLNDEKLLEIDVINGVTEHSGGYPNSGLCPECDHEDNGNISDSMDCSQQGVKHCAYATYQQWSTPKIIAYSLTGLAQAVIGDCWTRNCLGF